MGPILLIIPGVAALGLDSRFGPTVIIGAYYPGGGLGLVLLIVLLLVIFGRI